jgi:hypothetical protein
MLIP